MNHPLITFAPVALAALFVAACGGGAEFRPLAPRPHALIPKRPEAVEVVPAPTAGRNAVEVGRLEATSSAHPPTGDGRDEVLERLRTLAGEQGCDAIVTSEVTQSLFATSNGTPLYRAHQSAACFVYP